MCLRLAGSPQFLRPLTASGDGPVVSELGEFGDQVSVPAGDGEDVSPRTGRARRGIVRDGRELRLGPMDLPGLIRPGLRPAAWPMVPQRSGVGIPGGSSVSPPCGR